MRTWPIVLGLAACGNHTSKLDSVEGSSLEAVNALWDQAPDGTEVGIVASPKAIRLVLDGVTTAQDLFATPDFAPMKPTANALIGALLGTPDSTPTAAGLSAEKGFAMFITSDGVLGVMPVGDRDKFMATKHGTRGSGSDGDTLNGNICKPVRDLYVCATTEKLFERLGKASLRGKAAALAGGGGDVELYAPQIPLFGGGPGDLALTFVLSRGAVTARGMWTGKPGGTLGAMTGIVAPKPVVVNAAGFVAANLSKLVGGLPPIPVAGGVTFDALAGSLAGPISAVIPAGTVDIQVTAPLKDIAPAKTALEHCKDLGQFLDLADQQPANACRFKMQSASVLELEAWVDEAGKALRLGAHRDAPSPGAVLALTPIGEELAHGDWTAVFWGRGTMVNLTGITPITTDIPPAGAAALHAISLVNELGVGIKVDDQGVRLRGVVRTVWSNPPDVVAKVVAIPGADILHGKSTEQAKTIAAGASGSPFAADFVAGQGGLMVPAAALGIASAIIVPAIDSLLGNGGGDDQMPPMPTPADDPTP
jgi:hypothetical protein